MSEEEALTRPIIGIENRTGQEVFDIMADRIRRSSPAQAAMPVAVSIRPLEWTEEWCGADEDIPWWKGKNLLNVYVGVDFAGKYKLARHADAPVDELAAARAAAQSDYETRVRSALAPSDATPVAWQYRYRYDGPNTIWSSWGPRNPSREGMKEWLKEERPLYAHPASSVPPPLPGATHRHAKTGHLVREIGRGWAQVSAHPIEEMSAVSIYEHEGRLWVRNAVEFDDGRFEELSPSEEPK